MKHIVLLKFGENTDFEKISKMVENTYDELKNKYKVIVDYDYRLDTLKNGQNMDLALFIELENLEGLPTYINHKVHQKLLNDFKENGLSAKSAIDVN